MKRILIGVSAAIVFWLSPANGQTTCPPPPNQVTVSVTASTSFDANTQFYIYTYALASDASSAQDVVSLAISFEGSISNIRDPQGWDHGIMFTGSTVRWSADVAADFPPGVQITDKFRRPHFQSSRGAASPALLSRARSHPAP